MTPRLFAYNTFLPEGVQHVDLEQQYVSLQSSAHEIINENLWNAVKGRIKARNTSNKVTETWIDPINFVKVEGTSENPRIILGVPTTLHSYYITENLMDIIYTEVSESLKGPFVIDLQIIGQSGSKNSDNPFQNDPKSAQLSLVDMNPPQVFTQQTSTQRTNYDSINNDYTFSTFVVGRNTEFAHAACYNVARNPGQGYNPLFICGPVGMGKTHLLNAVGNQIKESNPYLRILYFSAEKFLNDCVSSIRRQEMEKFRQKYRENSDILLVDDVQYIGKGEATQEEFFHTINSFIERRKQVVLASDRMPKDILNLEDRNRSRLEWGLIADISMPDLETRMAILRYKSERMNLRVTEDVVNYIARISKRSIRELEGNLKKVKIYSELQGLSLDIGLVKRVLSTHETQTTLTMEDIQKLVSEYFKIRISDLKSSSRAKPFVVPRQISMFLIKRHLDKPLVDIGRIFGGKDHTTVINAIERITFLQSKDTEIKNDIDELTTRIHNITGV